MTALITLALVFVYLMSAIHVMRRLIWHFCHDKPGYERDGGMMGAFLLSMLVLPVGAVLLKHLDRTMGKEGAASFMLPPPKVRQEMYIRELERKLELR